MAQSLANLSCSDGELLAGCSGLAPSLANAKGRLLGPAWSWLRARWRSFVRRNFLASSEVKVTEAVLSPRNRSQPGAPRAARVAGELRVC